MRRADTGAALTLAASLGLGAGPADALTIHYDAQRDERLATCDAANYRGEPDEADACFARLLDDPSALVRAEALVALGRNTDANRVFRDAAAADPRDAAIRTGWARLYLATHQLTDAEALFREALLIDPGFVEAALGLAESTAQSFQSRARTAFEEVLAASPDEPAALLALAHMELELQRLGPARALLDRAEPALDERGLPLLEVEALRAGAALLEDRPIEPHVRAALAINPRYGDVHAIAAHFYIITYRYREAVELYRDAVALDPSLASAQRDLGINLLRLNELFGARHHLETAYELDPYDVRTVNTLKLIDSLDDMRISVMDVRPEGQPEAQPIGRVLIRLDREDADALEPYVRDLVTGALRTFTDRYDFRLQKPMIVELYHDHDDFGVRTVSTPGIGLLGVTFGYLTAMDSPKARAPGEFHWGSTLWHEIAHVFTIEATDHRLPRWFSEGLSVYEEWRTGPLRDRELSLDVLGAIARDRLLPVAELDAGFVRPSYQGQVQVSYMQAGLICDFIATRWGHEALVAMLDAFAGITDTADALQRAIGIGPAAFDAEFADWLRQRYGELLDTLDMYASLTRQMERARSMGDPISVQALARDVIRRYPERVGTGNAYTVLADAQREADDEAGAIETLLEWQRRGGHQPDVLRSLAASLDGADRAAEAARVREALNWVMPYDGDTHLALGSHYLATGDATRASREFTALLGLQPEDPVEARLGLARSAAALGDAGLARREVLTALETAPFHRPAQHFLLDLIEDDVRD